MPLLQSVLIIWAILGIVCGVLAIIPFLFWDLTEKKQLEMARDIKIRGYKEAFESGTLEQDNVEEAISLGVLTKEQAIEIGLVSKDAEDAFASEEVTTDTYSVDTNKE